jgi:hypothetical protein
MTQISLNDLMDKAQSKAEDMMRQHGQVLPFVLYRTTEGEEAAILPYNPPPTAIQRRLLALQIGNKMRENGAIAYAVAHEVWLASTPMGEAPKSLPSQNPNREERVWIQAHNAAAKEFRVFLIDRTAAPHRLLRDKEFDDAPWNPGGTWDNLLADPGKVH